jgi:hypothetical protein
LYHKPLILIRRSFIIYIKLCGTCLLDDFHISQTCISEKDLQKEDEDEDTKKWYLDYLELREFRKNEHYLGAMYFDCLLDPRGDDPIFIGIDRLVSEAVTSK